MLWSVFNDHQRTMVLQTVLVMNILLIAHATPSDAHKFMPSNVLEEPQEQLEQQVHHRAQDLDSQSVDWHNQRTAETTRLEHEQHALRELQASVDARYHAMEERQAQLDATHAQQLESHQQLVKFQQEMEEARRILTVDRAALVDERDHMLLDIDDRAQYLQPWETKLKQEQERLETVQRALTAEQQRLTQAHDNLRAQQEALHATRLEQDAAADVRTLELRQQHDDLNRKEVAVESEVRRMAQQTQRLEERMEAEHERARAMDHALSARHLAIEAREHELGEVQRQVDSMKSQLEQQRISLVC
jgi:hypothetical protein